MHYEVPAENYWQAEYFEHDPEYFKEQIDWFKKLSGHVKQPVALDIGSGLGKCMKAMERAGFNVYGIEPSASFAQKAIEKQNASADQLQVTSVEQAQFPANKFDFITFGAVLEHLYDPAQSLNSAVSWLKKGGLIHLEVPSAKWLLARLINKSYKVTAPGFVTNLSPMHKPFHIYEFTLESFQQYCSNLEVEVADHTHYIGDTFFFKPLNWILKPIMRKSNTGMQLTVWLRKTA